VLPIAFNSPFSSLPAIWFFCAAIICAPSGLLKARPNPALPSALGPLAHPLFICSPFLSLFNRRTCVPSGLRSACAALSVRYVDPPLLLSFPPFISRKHSLPWIPKLRTAIAHFCLLSVPSSFPTLF